MAKIKINTGGTVVEHYEQFLISKKASGLSEKTLATYRQHLSAISKHLETDIQIDALTKNALDEMNISMRERGLSSNSISSYTRTLKSFFSWCNEEGISGLNMKRYKAEETVKETYTDRELKTVCLMVTVLASKSTLSHFRPNTSLRCKPYTTVSFITG